MKHTSSQYVKLCNLLNYLRNNNMYFKSMFVNYPEITMENIRSIYEGMPTMSRNEILSHYSDYIDKEFSIGFSNKETMMAEIFDFKALSDNHDKVIYNSGQEWYVECTSGTTGRPFPIVKSKREKLLEAIYLSKCRKSICTNASLDNGFLLVHKNDPYIKSINYKENINEFKKIINYMEIKQPRWMFSTTYVLNRMMKYIEAGNVSPDNVYKGFQFIETTSQKLLPDEKEQIEKYFGCPIINNYGCREVWNIGYDCRYNNFHINEDILIIDIVDDAGRIITNENKIGDVIVTSLVHKTLPIIKYYIGDRAKIIYKQCACGKTTPIIVLQDGRESEKLKGTPYNGTTIFRKVLRMLYFKNITTDIKRIRVLQEEERLLVVYVEKDKNDDKVFEEYFTRYFYQRIKNYCKYKIIFKYFYPFNEPQSLYKQKIFES